jgi:hypothetical protein
VPLEEGLERTIAYFRSLASHNGSGPSGVNQETVL